MIHNRVLRLKKLKRNTTTKSGSLASALYSARLYEQGKAKICQAVRYGTVTRVNIPTDRETSRPRGFAFVDMEANSEEEAAISALDGVEMMERNLNVNKATPKKNRMANRGGGPAW
ncbi:RNA-binding protein (plasmid) [Acaryochloris sp. 'Moss Beach']|uniref:RNA recognition motif domain-containing protein n=1 Tax=Acaryochloris sp. 'Moss Beach' TaxID=2740837 RepID=UPI0037C021F2|nr:RNA-binding protein [Acaryochloris sp. 'Moss Beach']